MKPVPTHVFVPGESDQHPIHPVVLCAACSTPASNTFRHHDLQPQDQAITDHEHRKLGERGTQ